VDRYTHCLQTATRALKDGRAEEYVVCALLHDIGDTLGSYNHADIAAAILSPFVSEDTTGWSSTTRSFRATTFFSTLA
jgi:predicted HD phosphohydrolase